MVHIDSPNDFSQEALEPRLDGGKVTEYNVTNTYRHSQRKHYLYVHMVKARGLIAKEVVSGSCDPYAEVRLGKCKGTTLHTEKNSNPEWNQVFAFYRDNIEADMLEVIVKDKDVTMDQFMGWVLCDLCLVPKRVPPDSPLAPQWYRLEDKKGKILKGEVMLAVWWGTQADEAFPKAWHSDGASAEALANIRSKVYLSPKLWYLRVNVIEGQYVSTSEITRFPEAFVKATLGHQTMRTKISKNRSLLPVWNEDLMFVAAEPFEQPLILSLQDEVAPNNEVLGTCVIRLQDVGRRLDNTNLIARWFNLERNVIVEGEKQKDLKFACKIFLRICLEGGYHVFDETSHFSSDHRPTSRQLWKNSIGVLEVEIVSAEGLSPMKIKDGRKTTDAYCVAKYGTKWVRTRTIIDSFTPKWNEQYTWEVFDPCTVITIGVFDNCHIQGGDKGNGERDSKMGKVRIRLSTLETDRGYSYSYPLLVLHPNGVKKMGEIRLVVKFTCLSILNMMLMYSQPLWPKMHYIRPLTATQLDNLRHQAIQIVSRRLSGAEPPLRKEIVEYMLDVGSPMWSIRRSKANFFRIMGVLGGLVAVVKWFDRICNWKNPINTVVIHILFFILVLYPELILPSVFLYISLLGLWNYRWRPRNPPHFDTRLSYADNAHPDELDEEFDTFPTSRPADIIRMRYDRLRSISGRIQTVVGDLATQGERLQSLLSWRDPRATTLFVIFCLIAAIALYATPFYVVVIQTVISLLRHPRFRHRRPSVPVNFFKRLPDRNDSIL